MRDGDGLVFSEPTNASRRTIDLPGRTIEALSSHRKCQLEEKKLRAASYWDSQRPSQLLRRGAVAAMDEETTGIFGTDRIHRPAHRFHEHLSGAGRDLT